MLKSSFVALLKLRLGSRNDTDMAALINAEADAVQDELEQGPWQPWFLLSSDSTAVMSTVVNTVTLPTGLLGFPDDEDDDAISYLDDDGETVYLVRQDLKTLRQWGTQSDAEAADPTHVHIGPTQLTLYPQPATARTLRIDGYFADTAFSSVADAAENKWLSFAHDWLLGVVGERIARYIKDPEAAGAFLADANRGAERVYRRHVAWEEAMRDRKMEG